MKKKCFNHSNIESFEVCSSCGRSYCKNCLEMNRNNYYCFNHGCQLVLKIDERNKPQISQIQEPAELKKASFLLRAINFISDVVVFRALMSLTLDQLMSKQFVEQQAITTGDYMVLIIEVVIFIVYFFIFEALFQKTPGKFLTKTRVVNLNGDKPKFTSILLRTILRFLPFETFSISFRDKTWWHDRLSKTIVVVDNPPVNYEKNDADEQ